MSVWCYGLQTARGETAAAGTDDKGTDSGREGPSGSTGWSGRPFNNVTSDLQPI